MIDASKTPSADSGTSTTGGEPSREEMLLQEIESLRGQLMQSQKMGSVGMMTSSITHEFNNILMTVINYAKMGLRHQDDATRTKAFDRILSAGQRASRITTGMLSLARGNSQRQEATSLKHLIEDIMILVEKDLSVHRVQVEIVQQGDVWAALNVSQIQQVLLNLIINARQAMDGGGHLQISVSESDDGFAEIGVRDSGSGIPAEKLQHIFDPFFSTKSTDVQGQGGTGLGLAVCKEIVESHRGRIRVASAPGQGTCFTLRLPAVPAPNAVPVGS